MKLYAFWYRHGIAITFVVPILWALLCIGITTARAQELTQLLDQEKTDPGQVDIRNRKDFLQSDQKRQDHGNPASGNSFGATPAVDITGIWYWLKHNQLAKAQEELNRIENEYPGWIAPVPLMDAFAIAKVRFAIAQGQLGTARDLLAGIPKTKISWCENPDIAWALQGQKTLWDMVNQCRQPDIVAESLRQYVMRAPKNAQLGLAIKLLSSGRSDQQNDVLLGILYNQLSDAQVLVNLHNDQLAVLRDLAVKHKNPKVGMVLAWFELRFGMPAEALMWFDRARIWGAGTSEVIAGKASALMALGRLDEAATLAEAYPALRNQIGQKYYDRVQVSLQKNVPLKQLITDVEMAQRMGYPDIWSEVGWHFFDAKQYDEAQAAFDRAPEGTVDYGKTLVAIRKGEFAKAKDIACRDNTQDSNLQKACVDVLSEEQLKNYNNQNYGVAVEIGHDIQRRSPDTRGSAILTAWSLWHLDQFDAAADAFLALYDKQKDADLAEGVVQSLQAAGRENELQQRILAGDHLLEGKISLQEANNAWGRKQFDLAARKYHRVDHLADNPQNKN